MCVYHQYSGFTIAYVRCHTVGHYFFDRPLCALRCNSPRAGRYLGSAGGGAGGAAFGTAELGAPASRVTSSR